MSCVACVQCVLSCVTDRCRACQSFLLGGGEGEGDAGAFAAMRTFRRLTAFPTRHDACWCTWRRFERRRDHLYERSTEVDDGVEGSPRPSAAAVGLFRIIVNIVIIITSIYTPEQSESKQHQK